MKSLKIIMPFRAVCALTLFAATSLSAQQMEKQVVVVAPGEEKTAGFAAKNPGITFHLDVKPGGGHKFKTTGGNGILGENRDDNLWWLDVNSPELKTYKVLVKRTDAPHEAVFKMHFEKPESSGGGGGGGHPSNPPPAYVKAVNCFVKIYKPGSISAPGPHIPTPTVAGKPYFGILLTNTDEEITPGTADHTNVSKTGDGKTKDDDLVKVELSWNPIALKPHMVENKELELILPADTKAYLASGEFLTGFKVKIGSAATGQLAPLGGSGRKQDIFIEGTAAWASTGGSREVVLRVNDLDYDGAESKALLLPIIIKKVGFTNGHDIASDDLVTDYVSPQWEDLNGDRNPAHMVAGEHNYPVAYTRDTKPTIGAEFSVPGLPAGVTASISATGTDGVNIVAELATITGSTVTLAPKEAGKAFPDNVRFYDRSTPRDPAIPASPPSTDKGFNLEWKVTFSDIGLMPAGKTSHQAYITFGDPIATFNDQVPVTRIQKQEVLFYIGCKGADTKNTGADVWQGIWSEFSDRVVQRVDKNTGDASLDAPNADGGVGMIYWRLGVLLIPRDLDEMLEDGHSTCGSWSVLLQACANTQGISGHDDVLIEAPEPIDYSNLISDYRSVYSVPPANTVSFRKIPNTGIVAMPAAPAHGDICLLVDSDNDYSTHGVFFVKTTSIAGNFVDVPASDAGFPAPSSSPAQGNSNAKAWFGNHGIVKYDGKYYDPSYGGVPFSGKAQWEDGSLQYFGAYVKSHKYDASIPKWVRMSVVDILWKERTNPAGGPECHISP